MLVYLGGRVEHQVSLLERSQLQPYPQLEEISETIPLLRNQQAEQRLMETLTFQEVWDLLSLQRLRELAGQVCFLVRQAAEELPLRPVNRVNCMAEEPVLGTMLAVLLPLLLVALELSYLNTDGD